MTGVQTCALPIWAFLSCFVIDVAIILFNRRGLVTFSWQNLFCLVKSNIYIYIYIYITLFHVYFLFTYFLMYIFFALPPPFLEQPSLRWCASCCKPCDHIGSASFEINDPRRSWRAIVLFVAHGDARASVFLSCLVREPRRSYGYT